MINQEHFLKEFQKFISSQIYKHIKEAVSKGELFYFTSKPNIKIKVTYLERALLYTVEVERGEEFSESYEFDVETFETLKAVVNFLKDYQ